MVSEGFKKYISLLQGTAELYELVENYKPGMMHFI